MSDEAIELYLEFMAIVNENWTLEEQVALTRLVLHWDRMQAEAGIEPLTEGD